MDLFDLRASEARTDLLRKIGQRKAELGGFGHVFLELREVHFVVGVGDGVVVFQIVRFFLIGDKSGNAFQHEIEMIGAPFHVGFHIGDAELLQRRDDALGGLEHIFAAAVGEARGLAGAGIVDDDAGGLVEFRPVRDGVGARTEQAFLFAGKKNEADGAARLQSGGFDGAQRVHHQRGVAAVIESAGAEFPRIQMRAENDKFVGLFAAFDFRDHICGFDRPADLIGNA